MVTEAADGGWGLGGRDKPDLFDSFHLFDLSCNVQCNFMQIFVTFSGLVPNQPTAEWVEKAASCFQVLKTVSEEFRPLFLLIEQMR